LAFFVTFQMLGAGIGLTTIDPATGDTPGAGTLSTGAAVWWLVTGLISLFIGGWVAGRLGWLSNKLDRLLHGLTVWAGFYALMFWMVTTAAGVLVGGGLSLLGNTVSAAGRVAGSPQAQEAAEQAMENRGLSPDAIQQEIAKLTGSAPGQGQQNTGDLATAVGDYFKGPKTAQDRQQLAQRIAQATGKSEAEANQMIDNLDRQAQQAKQTGEEVVNITGATFIGLAIAMFLGAAAAMLGSLMAPAPRYVPSYKHEVAARTPEHTYASR
jgi:K+-transporting ATPase c subunit